jgi:hypothetical protein
VRDYEARHVRLPAPSRRQAADFLAAQEHPQLVRARTTHREARRKSR